MLKNKTMKIRKLILATITTIVMLCCNKKADNIQIDTINTDFTKTFEGQIENKYDIQMKLISNNGNITGYYFYKNIGDNIEIKGNVDSQGKISISEFDKKGNQTGAFKGEMLNENKIQGTWSKPNGSNSKPFFLLISNSSKNTEYAKVEFNDDNLNDILNYYQEQANSENGGKYAKFEDEFSKEFGQIRTYRHTPDEEEIEDYRLFTIYLPQKKDMNLIYGDLNNDNLQDLVVSISVEGPGSGRLNSYSEVFVYLNKNNKLTLIENAGDNFVCKCKFIGFIYATKIENGYLICDTYCCTENDSYAEPSLKYLTKFKLTKNKLVYDSQHKVK